MTKSIYVKDMRKHVAKSPVLHCQGCGMDFSADPNDYWDTPEDEAFTCSECDEPMILATKHTVYRKVR